MEAPRERDVTLAECLVPNHVTVHVANAMPLRHGKLQADGRGHTGARHARGGAGSVGSY